MLLTALILFAITAVFGIAMATMASKGKIFSRFWTIGHGIFGVAALATLIYAVTQLIDPGYASAALIIFIIAALGGFTLLYMDIARRKLPLWMVGIHGAVAVIGFLTLLASVIMRQ